MSSYSGILYRKNNGAIVLSEASLNFRPEAATSGQNITNSDGAIELPWNRIIKHQVSPASHPKSLLKVLVEAAVDVGGGGEGGVSKNNTSLTFVFPTRNELERARREITTQLSKHRNNNNNSNSSSNNKKRPRTMTTEHGKSSPPSSAYIAHDPMALIATRSSLLASDPALRAQHRLLVIDNGTLSEEDFWETHHRLVADEYAKISGRKDAGMSSALKSSLDLGISRSGAGNKKKKSGGDSNKDDDKKDDKSSSNNKSSSSISGVVHLGVEEIRQIFLMYPAVHRAYEEKVPLELSEEQFWRKYLESEYFHRDRGRIGAHIGRVNEREQMETERFGRKKQGNDVGDKKKKDGEDNIMGEDEANTRLAAAGTDDLFSRYERGLTGATLLGGTDSSSNIGASSQSKKKLGTTNLAVGQFDLASTAETERGDRFLSGLDLHPPPEEGSQGARIIDKYNRHWAIVLHPKESTAGVDLSVVAAKRAAEGGGDAAEEDAKVNGGTDRETRRLIGFANADEANADFARCTGDNALDDGAGNAYAELHLRNVDAYSGKFGSNIDDKAPTTKNEAEMNLKYAKFLAAATLANTETILKSNTTGKSKGFCNAPTL